MWKSTGTCDPDCLITLCSFLKFKFSAWNCLSCNSVCKYIPAVSMDLTYKLTCENQLLNILLFCLGYCVHPSPKGHQGIPRKTGPYYSSRRSLAALDEQLDMGQHPTSASDCLAFNLRHSLLFKSIADCLATGLQLSSHVAVYKYKWLRGYLAFNLRQMLLFISIVLLIVYLLGV